MKTDCYHTMYICFFYGIGGVASRQCVSPADIHHLYPLTACQIFLLHTQLTINDLRFRVRRQNAITNLMLSCEWRWMPYIWEGNHMRQFWEVIIPNHFDDRLRCCSVTLVHWLVQLCEPLHPSSQEKMHCLLPQVGHMG